MHHPSRAAVSNRPSWHRSQPPPILADEVHTIREIDDHPVYGVALRLNEIHNASHQYNDGFKECGFAADHFVPAKKTSIEVFRSALTDPPAEDA